MNTQVAPQVQQSVNAIFIELFELTAEELTPEKRLFEDLGLDSLDAIDMAIRFQKQFRMKPSNQEIQDLRNLGDIYVLVERYTVLSSQG